METKDFHPLPFQFKAEGDQGIVEGWASTFGGPPDTYGDIVVRGAFADSLKRYTPKLLWQHDMRAPIARVIDLAETDHGLYGRWQLADTTAAREAHANIKAGLVDGLSIGFMTEESDINEDGNRLLKKVNLLEVSAVTIPANGAALITGIKADIPFDMLLQQVAEALRDAVQEAKALTGRRMAEGRALNDRHSRAISALLAEAKATSEGLAALVVVAPEAKADELEAMTLRLELARRRLAHAGILRESA